MKTYEIWTMGGPRLSVEAEEAIAGETSLVFKVGDESVAMIAHGAWALWRVVNSAVGTDSPDLKVVA